MAIVNVWVTTDCLSTGRIEHMQLDRRDSSLELWEFLGDEICNWKMHTVQEFLSHIDNNEWHLSEESALSQADEMRTLQIKSLLELSFEVTDRISNAKTVEMSQSRPPEE